jgi:hypothetical protein
MESFMGNAKSKVDLFQRLAGKTSLGYGLLLMFWITGCGGKTTANTATPPPSPQTYFAPYVIGTSYETTDGTSNGTSDLTVPVTYTVDDVAGKFSQTTYQLQPPQQVGPQVMNAGVLSVAANGLRSLGITTTYLSDSNNGRYDAVPYPTPKTGSYAVELDGQAGGLMQLVGQPVAPLVAATQCPNFTTPKTYQFITIPAAQAFLGTAQIQFTWDPTAETAYGSVDISSSGSTVTFQNIHQYTLPSSGGSGSPAQPALSSETGICGTTFFGNVTNIPGQLVITDPGNGSQPQPQATIGIDPTGEFLVEYNGTSAQVGTLSGTSPALYYENVLGAGTGAVGLSKPASALDSGAVVGAHYLGFIYSPGTHTNINNGPLPMNWGWSSHLASFGFSSVPSSCASVAAGSGTLIYGGDFPNDDPSGSGNCDFAIDLGTQDAANNGLYPHATVWVGASYAANPSGVTYSFPAVAIAGQIKGKYAIFLIGADSTQPWAVYLLQSN